MSKLVAIDGHNILWRSFSVPFRFYSQKGTPLHVVTTFLKCIRRSISAANLTADDRLVVVFDSDTISPNHLLSSQYKSNRKYHFPDDQDNPFKHLPLIKEVLSNLSIQYFEIANQEADDVIATIVYKHNNQNTINTSYIVSSDSDFYQLIDQNTFVIKLKSQDQFDLIDIDYIQTMLGITPSDYVLFKSLTGDKADNIEGIKGVGPKTAYKIIRQQINFDTTPYQSILELNHQLIKLNCDVTLQIVLSDYEFNHEVMTMTNKDIFNICKF